MTESIKITSPSGAVAGNEKVRLYATAEGLARLQPGDKYIVKWTLDDIGGAGTFDSETTDVLLDVTDPTKGYNYGTTVTIATPLGLASKLTATLYKNTTSGQPLAKHDHSITFRKLGTVEINAHPRGAPSAPAPTLGTDYLAPFIVAKDATTQVPIDDIDVLWRTDFNTSEIFFWDPATSSALDKIVTGPHVNDYYWLSKTTGSPGASTVYITSTRPYALTLQPYVSGSTSEAELQTDIYFANGGYDDLSNGPGFGTVTPQFITTYQDIEGGVLELEPNASGFNLKMPNDAMSVSNQTYFLALNSDVLTWGDSSVLKSRQQAPYVDLKPSLAELTTPPHESDRNFATLFFQDDQGNIQYTAPYYFYAYGSGRLNQPQPTPLDGSRDRNLPQVQIQFLAGGKITYDTLSLGGGLQVKLPASVALDYAGEDVTFVFYMNGYVHDSTQTKWDGPPHPYMSITKKIASSGATIATLPMKDAVNFSTSVGGSAKISYVDYYIGTTEPYNYGPYPTAAAPTGTYDPYTNN